jgi:ribosomal protein S18 acetylase RimI-like enzyme
MDKVIIRKAKLKDMKLCAEIFRIESAKSPYNKVMTSKKALKSMEKDFKETEIYVAITEDKIIGFIMVRKDSGIKSQLWILELWLLKKYQNHGIGKKLMDEIEKIYKKKGIRCFRLVADTREGGAENFYKKLNYNQDMSTVFMEKKV